ncbi:MAG: glycosyltransferase family 2 protein [Burkholderiaceae bacterium]|nr:glycosyltransferase family 2 protein [Burkholderiaceae bacterium]
MSRKKIHKAVETRSAFDVTAIINFHAEDLLSIPAIRSFNQCCDYAISQGISIQKIAVLDKPSQVTSDIVNSFSSIFSKIEFVNYGDLGESRNHGASIAEGRFASFFDGDDLWGKKWLANTYETARFRSEDELGLFHPEVIYYFSDSDFRAQSQNDFPSNQVKSFYFMHKDSNDPSFDKNCLRFNNVYTSNTFGPVKLYRKYPFLKANRSLGFGVEDWAWHAQSVNNGIRHEIVPGTVHIVRVKTNGSLGMANAAEGLLPPLHSYFPAWGEQT